MKNWKTSLGGFGAGLAAIGAGIQFLQAGDYEKAATAIVGGVCLIWHGWHGVDSNKDGK
jgi:hypothetical protein